MEENCRVRVKPKTFKELMYSSYFWKPALSFLIGGILGYLYYYFEGSLSGSHGIGSDPFSSVIFGGVLGWFLVNRPCRCC
jgi:hypothetical protein